MMLRLRKKPNSKLQMQHSQQGIRWILQQPIAMHMSIANPSSIHIYSPPSLISLSSSTSKTPQKWRWVRNGFLLFKSCWLWSIWIEPLLLRTLLFSKSWTRSFSSQAKPLISPLHTMLGTSQWMSTLGGLYSTGSLRLLKTLLLSLWFFGSMEVGFWQTPLSLLLSLYYFICWLLAIGLLSGRILIKWYYQYFVCTLRLRNNWEGLVWALFGYWEKWGKGRYYQESFCW